MSIFLSSLALIVFQVTSTWGIMFNISFMLIAGVCNCGPDPLLTGSVPAKIGEKVNAQAAVSGVVNGKLFNGSKALGERNHYVSNDAGFPVCPPPETLLRKQKYFQTNSETFLLRK